MKLQKIHNQISLHNNGYLLDKIFFKDSQLEFIFKKTERICMAVYLITNFFVSEEPLKWSLRNSATKVLNNVLSYSTGALSHREKNSINLHSEILGLVSYFDLAFNSGFISNMNYEIMASEIDKLISEIKEYNSSTLNVNQGLFDREYFQIEKSFNDHQDVADDYKGHENGGHYSQGQTIKDNIKDNAFQVENTNDFARQTNTSNNRINQSDYKLSSQTSPITKRTIPRINSTNLKRQEKILAEVKKQKSVSVKDITGVLPNYSAKTLQRELIAMVEAGLLVKTGERRWSRYSLR